jgi:hypothetical protein
MIGGIFEGPYEWPVRPAWELIAQHSSSRASAHSALAALIWRKQENLSQKNSYSRRKMARLSVEPEVSPNKTAAL